MEEFKKALFAQGDEGVFGFRIPSILALASGRVLAFCEARRDSLGDSGRIDIVMRAGDGVSFGPVRTVVSGGNDTVGNPCPVQDPATGRVFLLYNRNEADRPEPMILRGDGPRTVHVVYSDDEGETWSPPRDITADVKKPDWTWYAVGPCHGVALPDGRLMFGCNHAVLDREAGRSGAYVSHVIFSDDHGASWRLGPDMAPGTNESALASFSDGGVLINMRFIPFGEGAENPRCRAQAYSADGLRYSDTALRRDLTDPVCQGSLLTVRTAMGEEVLLSNAASARRENLCVRRSADRGQTWRLERVIEPGCAAYSDMTQLPDGRVALLCEAGAESPYERIDLHVFGLK
ncbi:MAG: exo-alpha-sialidase [Clostridia bacterium]|nr:exo-alpha-sialidase [Clostridia bacterium]